MTGKPNRPVPLSPAQPFLKRPVVLGAIVIAVTSAAAAGAWLTRAPESAAPRSAKASTSRPPSVEAAAAIAVPTATPPPPPTSADIARDPSTANETAANSGKQIDWAKMPVADLRTRAEADEIAAMEELARRLVQGIGVTKDQQAGAGWLLRAAQAGSAQSAFNVGVMYERGFVVERDSTRAIEWYRKAVDGGLPMARHNLALLLRDGKGAARNGKEAIELLRAATRQGMAASMFTLGDIYERGDAAPKDAAMAMAWFAITGEYERQTNNGTDTALARTATQRAQALQRVLTPAELERAQQVSQSEFKQIVAALQPPKPPEPAPPPAETAAPSPPPVEEADPPGWPKALNDQVRAIQQALLDLKLLRDKPDGAIGPMTRAAIRTFQRSAGLRETGEPTRDVYAALKEALARRDAPASTPPKTEAKVEPPKVEVTKPEEPKAEAPKVEAPKAEAPKVEVKVEPPRQEPPKVEPATAEAPKVAVATAEPPKVVPAVVEPPRPEAARQDPARVDLPRIDPPKPPMPPIATEKPTAPAVVAKPEPRNEPKVEARPAPLAAAIDIGRPEAPPPPPTSADIARLVPAPEPKKADPDAWPAVASEQVKAVQSLLRELNFYREAADGLLGPATRTAIRDYERLAGLKVTGDPSKALFDSLKELRLLMSPKPATATGN